MSTDSLRGEIARLLEPLCDADPLVLADYVLVLRDSSSSPTDQSATFTEQLSDFLGDNTDVFVMGLMNLLRSSGSSGSARDAGYRPEGYSSGGRSYGSARDGDGYGRGDRDSYGDRRGGGDRDGPRHEERRRSISPSRRHQPSAPSDGERHGRRKEVCRNFTQRGFCLRGDQCPYDHGNGAFQIPATATDGLPRQPRGNGPRPHSGPGGARPVGGAGGGGRDRVGPGAGNGPYVPGFLVMEGIPKGKATEPIVRATFAPFGTLLDVRVDAEANRAIVRFSSHDEAHAAHSSPEPFFSNRFVRVFWRRLQEGETQESVLADWEASGPPPPSAAPILSPEEALAAAKARAVKAAEARVRAERLKKVMEAQAHKKRLLDALILEQRALVTRMSNPTVPFPPEELEAATAKISGIERAVKACEELLKQLESTGTSAVGSPETAAAPMPADRKVQLEAQLAALRQEAKALGVHGVGVPGPGGMGRGRGAGGYAPKGPPIPTMAPGMNKLDNRTTRIHVRGITAAARPNLPSHFAAFGHITAWEPLGEAEDEVILQYAARWEAEKAMLRGAHVFGSDEPLSLAWSEAVSSAAASTPTRPAPFSRPAAPGGEEMMIPADEDEEEDDEMGEGDSDRDWRR